MENQQEEIDHILNQEEFLKKHFNRILNNITQTLN
jgi:hypothetical protein